MRIAVWLDDLRDPTSGYFREVVRLYAPQADSVVWVKTYHEFQDAVTNTVSDPEKELTALFFDNDLGDTEEGLEGRHAFTWFEMLVHESGLPRVVLHAQTADPAAKRELTSGFAALERHWSS